MYFIDSHCHLHDQEFFDLQKAEQALQKATYCNVKQIIVIGTSERDSLAAAKFAQAHTDVFYSYGVHPSEAAFLNDLQFASLDGQSPIAIGEVGLDYHYQPIDRKAQIKLFERMLELATARDLPLIFHVREAFDDFFAIIENTPNLRGVVHSFTDSKKNLRKVLDHGFYVGVNGLATYSTLPTPPLERILLETDAPFLTPEPFRGTINEPAYVPDIAKWLAVKLEVPVEQIAEITTQNAKRLFNLPDPVVRRSCGL